MNQSRMARRYSSTFSTKKVLLTPYDFTANQPAADFAGAGTDFVELGIAEEAACGKIVGVAVATEDLDRLGGDGARRLRRVEDDAGGIGARRGAAVGGLGDGIDIGAGGIGRDVHVGKLAL